MIVIADASPMSYLILLGKTDLLPRLYGRVLIPHAVSAELGSEKSPPAIQTWMAHPPNWFEVRKVHVVGFGLDKLDAGEREAISLAQELEADLLLLDDWDARQEALRRHLTVGGTLRVLDDAARLNLINLPDIVAQLRGTNFRIKESILQTLLARDAQRKAKKE